jgi:hypothetical protein
MTRVSRSDDGRDGRAEWIPDFSGMTEEPPPLPSPAEPEEGNLGAFAMRLAVRGDWGRRFGFAMVCECMGRLLFGQIKTEWERDRRRPGGADE